jgi:hypothetical protein
MKKEKEERVCVRVRVSEDENTDRARRISSDER